MSDIHVSFDLETLHTRADGAILSIGAAARVDGEIVTFYSACNLESQSERAVSQDTLDWWQKNPELWQKTMNACSFSPDLSDVLRDLNKWYASLGTDKDELFPWGNGANFDIAFLEHAFDECSQNTAWHYHTTRDLRTIKHVAKLLGGHGPVERVGTHHDARDDAIFQLHLIEACMEEITHATD